MWHATKRNETKQIEPERETTQLVSLGQSCKLQNDIHFFFRAVFNYKYTHECKAAAVTHHHSNQRFEEEKKEKKLFAIKKFSSYCMMLFTDKFTYTHALNVCSFVCVCVFKWRSFLLCVAFSLSLSIWVFTYSEFICWRVVFDLILYPWILPWETVFHFDLLFSCRCWIRTQVTKVIYVCVSCLKSFSIRCEWFFGTLTADTHAHTQPPHLILVHGCQQQHHWKTLILIKCALSGYKIELGNLLILHFVFICPNEISFSMPARENKKICTINFPSTD